MNTTNARRLGDINAVLSSLNICRSSLYGLMRNDPSFPSPVDITNKLQFFMDEVETWKESRPRRLYSAVVAILAVVGVAALSSAKSLLA